MARRPTGRIRASFADAQETIAAQTSPDDPPAEFPRGDTIAGKWDGAPFDKLPPACPVVPLGVHGKLSFFIDGLGQFLSFEGMKEDGLIKLFRLTPNYLYWAWPRWSTPKADGSGEKPKPKINGVEIKKAIACLEKACAVRGPFDPSNRLRGRGAWRDNHGRLIWHSGDALWTVDHGKLKSASPGEIDGVFYFRGPTIMKPWPEPVPAHESPARQIFDALKSWTWQRQTIDPVIVLGALGVMLLCGALEERPHVAAMGDFGTGKTELQRLIFALLGTALVKTENTSEAGLRQHMGLDALPVSLDEFEASEDNRRAMAIVELARIAYSGGRLLRGGQDHKGVEFTSRNAFFASGINLPPMKPQDRSRFAVLNLGKLDIGERAPPVIHEEWGRMILRALMDAWPQWNGVHADWRSMLRHAGLTGRGQDTYGTLFAMAQLMLGETGMEDIGLPVTEAEKLGAMIADATVDERSTQTDNWRDCLDFLLGHPIDAWKGGEKPTIGALTLTLEGEGSSPDFGAADFASVREKIAHAGCGLVEDTDDTLPAGKRRYLLAVPSDTPGLSKMFFGSKWQQGGWYGALKQAPPHIVIRDRGNKQKVKINRITKHCLLVDLKAYDKLTEA